MSIVLASGSPRRLELLRSIGLHPEVRPAEIDESQRPGEPALDYTSRLARQKAERVAKALPEEVTVLGADTIVHLVEHGQGLLLGKPASLEEARSMLSHLSGTTHEVVTAYYVRRGTAERSRTIHTRVSFRPILAEEIEGYLATEEWCDKAGAYAVQGIAAAFVRAIEGSYTNVVGLPLCEVLEDLRALGSLPADFVFGGQIGRLGRL